MKTTSEIQSKNKPFPMIKNDISEQLLHLASKRGWISLDFLQKKGILSKLNVDGVQEEIRSKSDLILLDALIARGLLEFEDLVDCGLISEEQKCELLEEMIRLDLRSSTDVTESQDEPQIPALNPIETFGRYLILGLIGEGGMAEVYKVHDPQLQRHVALKILRIADPAFKERLIREAKAQAKIEHKNICKVYEVGEMDRRAYIAMQYVEGHTLLKAGVHLNIEQKAGLIREIAEALHEAHRLGLIHRDIKPNNIIVERKNDGQLVPYLVDFGLAREISEAGVTATDMVVGTPLYMSPEQAAGRSHSLDRRTDLFSLGLTAYELLSGTHPFARDNNLGILQKLIHADPVPLRKSNPSIPSDLETVVMKCLEKDPDRRYDSAKTLGEDLQRYLNGDVLLAKPPAFSYRIYKKAKKHRSVLILVGIALFAMVFLAAVALKARLAAGRQALLAQRFGEEVNNAESIMQRAYLLPLHDVRQEMEMVRARLNSIQMRMKQLSKEASASGEYALGRGYMALHEYEEARAHLERAWIQHKNQQPEVAQALGLTLAALYQNELMKAEQIRDKRSREIRKKQIEKEYRDQALHYIHQSHTSNDPPEYVEATIAFLEKRYEVALKKAETAITRVPWLYGARTLEGDVYLQLAKERSGRGERESAMESFRKAEDSYERALEIARSDSQVYEKLCGLETYVASRQMEIDDAFPKETLQKGLKACEFSLTANPKNVGAYYNKSRTFFRWASYQMDHGEDPQTTLEKSIQAAEEGLRLEPNHYFARIMLGEAHWLMGEWRMEKGLDPRTSLDRAIQTCAAAIRINPNLGAPYSTVGNAWSAKGSYELQRGMDASRSLKQAIESHQQSVRLNPRAEYTHYNLGTSYQILAEWEMNRGMDPRPNLERALRSYQETSDVNPTLPIAHTQSGTIYALIAKYQMQMGLDATRSLTLSIQNHQKATEKNSSDAYAQMNIAITYSTKAEYEIEKGRNPNESISEARTSIEKAKRVDPDLAWIHFTGGRIEMIAGQWNINRDQSPAAALEKAKRSFDRALQLNPQESKFYIALAEAESLEAEWQIRKKSDPESSIKKGLEFLSRSLEINNAEAEAYAIRGLLFLMRSESTRNSLMQNQFVQDAQTDIRHALHLNRNLKRKHQPHLEHAASLARNSSE